MFFRNKRVLIKNRFVADMNMIKGTIHLVDRSCLSQMVLFA